MDPDPAIFVIDLQDANKKLIFKKKVFCLLLFEGTYTSFKKDKKVQKKSQNSMNQGFSYDLCLMTEGSGPGSGSLLLTSGSGSGRPKNMWIRWIRNTGFFLLQYLQSSITSKDLDIFSFINLPHFCHFWTQRHKVILKTL
jgi:hypothetical protein